MALQNLIKNYYEKLVAEAIMAKVPVQDLEELADIACVALNNLPPRYFRHEVDMVFYMSPQEHQVIEDRVEKAVSEAIDYVKLHHDKGE